jgi:Tfp pilus assembly protein PilX
MLRSLRALALLALLGLTGARSASQSGRGLLHGYVAFEDVSYNEVTQGAIRAKVELRGSGEFNSKSVYSAETDRRGAFDLPAIGMGEYVLRITAPGHAPYQIPLYIPSDFECRLAVLLKKAH